MKFEEKIAGFIKEHKMIVPGDRIVAGVSGGADSVALLHFLSDYRKQADFSLAVVHVNHNLRKGEALEDQEFVRRLCQEKDITFRCCSVDVAALAKEKHYSLEEAGRLARRQCFEEFQKEWRGTRIALAHHKNDVAETMLHHLVRGSGLSGLSGIRPADALYIRPLLCLKREEIEQYLEEADERYRTDSTNLDDMYTRNKLRHHVISYLEQEINPRAVEHMARTAGILEEADAYLQMQAEQWLKENGSLADDQLFLPDAFVHLPHILRMYVIRLGIEHITDSRKDIGFGHYQAVDELFEKAEGKQISLPQKVRAVRCFEGVRILSEWNVMDGQKKTEKCAVRRELRIPGITALEEGEVHCQTVENDQKEIPEKTYTKWLNYDKIKDTLMVRTREPGDYLIINEEGGRKKLKDYFIDCKIPKQERERILLVAAGHEVLWVIGYRISESYKVHKHTKKVLRIEYKGGTNNGS